MGKRVKIYNLSQEEKNFNKLHIGPQLSMHKPR